MRRNIYVLRLTFYAHSAATAFLLACGAATWFAGVEIAGSEWAGVVNFGLVVGHNGRADAASYPSAVAVEDARRSVTRSHEGVPLGTSGTFGTSGPRGPREKTLEGEIKKAYDDIIVPRLGGENTLSRPDRPVRPGPARQRPGREGRAGRAGREGKGLNQQKRYGAAPLALAAVPRTPYLPLGTVGGWGWDGEGMGDGMGWDGMGWHGMGWGRGRQGRYRRTGTETPADEASTGGARRWVAAARQHSNSSRRAPHRAWAEPGLGRAGYDADTTPRRTGCATREATATAMDGGAASAARGAGPAWLAGLAGLGGRGALGVDGA